MSPPGKEQVVENCCGVNWSTKVSGAKGKKVMKMEKENVRRERACAISEGE